MLAVLAVSVLTAYKTCRILPAVAVVAIVPSATSGIVKTLLLLDDEGACKLKDPPPEAAFSLIFAVIYPASNAATFVSNVVILADNSLTALIKIGVNFV